MVRRKILTAKQREIKLRELIKDAKELNFSNSLIKNFERQLREVQREIERDKVKKSDFKRVERGLNQNGVR